MIFSMLISLGMLAQPSDTLRPVTIVADRGVVVSRTDTLTVQPLQDVSSTLQLLPGLYIGDYGSAAGLKSASLRGLGSAHTAIYIDGVRVGNVQSGQADLGLLDMQSVGSVVADYAQNSLSFITARPVFSDEGPFSGTVRVQHGSFGTWQPYGRLNYRYSSRWCMSATAGGIVTSGAFPLADGSLRSNNDLAQMRLGGDLWGTFKDSDLHVKLYYNGAERGTPGSLSWPSADRQQDRNLLGQLVYRKTFSPLYSLQLSGKSAYDKLLYISEWGNTTYEQTDFQLNSAHKFHIKPWWELSLASSVSLDGLASELYTRNRLGTVISAATAFRWTRLKADLAVEYAGVFDDGGASWNSFSPSADLRFTLTEGLDLVAFGRRAYRTPTFNELYYPGYGNASLKPEDAWLADAGLDFHRAIGRWTLKARLDGYYNWLSNKIISAPSEADPSIWLPYNVGKVQAMGADAQLAVDYKSGAWACGLNVRYGWQKAVDKTEGSYSFDQQIPYVARHTLSAGATLAWNGWTLEGIYNLRAGRVDATGEMPDWNTLDATFRKEFSLVGPLRIGLQLIGRNLLDCRYEVVSGYPMPGRSILAGLSFSF